jgi:response regulator RpfG family c-di-GMP phosphodiesterase
VTTILLVDDEPTILRVLARELAPEGYRILTATGGKEALRLLAEGDVSVLVTDERMPGMRGTEMVRAAREISPLTACLLLVTRADQEAAAAALARGWISRALTKPWDFKELQRAIRFAADGYDLRRRNETLRCEARELSEQVARQIEGSARTIRLALAALADDIEAGRGPEATRPTLDRAVRATEDLARAALAIAARLGAETPAEAVDVVPVTPVAVDDDPDVSPRAYSRVDPVLLTDIVSA